MSPVRNAVFIIGPARAARPPEADEPLPTPGAPRASVTTRRRYSRVRTGSGQPLEDHRHALATANAHGLQAEGIVVEPQAVQERRGEPGTGHPERVPDRDRPAVHVELVQVDAELLV